MLVQQRVSSRIQLLDKSKMRLIGPLVWLALCLPVSVVGQELKFKAKFSDLGCPTEAMIRDFDRFLKENNLPAMENLVHPGACQTYQKGTVGTIKESNGTYACFLPNDKSTCIWVDRENLKPK